MRFSHLSNSGPARFHRGLPVLAVALSAFLSTTAFAGNSLTANDVAFSLNEFSGTVWRSLGSGTVEGYFGPHRCACPVTLAPLVQLTASGQANIGASVIGVEFLLGPSCATSPASCTSLGKVAFTADQHPAPPNFNSALVFQSAAGSTSVACTSLTVGTTYVWAILTQDGVALNFAPAIELDVTSATVSAPASVTASPGDAGITVHWAPPANTSLVAGYQVLCLPGPSVAKNQGYESCGLTSVTGSTVLTPADKAQICSAQISPSQTSVRVDGLVNGTPYTLAVVAIDASGGISAMSPPATATPQPTNGFYEKYKQDGGAATSCAYGSDGSLSWLSVGGLVALLAFAARRRRRLHRKLMTLALVGALAWPAAQAQDMADDWSAPGRSNGEDWAANPEKSNNDWATNPASATATAYPDWGVEVGFSPYHPNVDSEFGGTVHPYADTFSSGHQLMSEAEVDRYVSHRFGTWGLGFRAGYLRATGSSFLADGSRSGDETSLRIIPLSLAAVYRAQGIPGLRRAALVPYAKAGFDVAVWTAGTTGKPSRTGMTPGWHAACGVSLGLNLLGLGAIKQGEIAGPGALFFEWDWAQLDGLGMRNRLHVGDSTWYLGLLFDF